jgi:hypothetical protein
VSGTWETLPGQERRIVGTVAQHRRSICAAAPDACALASGQTSVTASEQHRRDNCLAATGTWEAAPDNHLYSKFVLAEQRLGHLNSIDRTADSIVGIYIYIYIYIYICISVCESVQQKRRKTTAVSEQLCNIVGTYGDSKLRWHARKHPHALFSSSKLSNNQSVRPEEITHSWIQTNLQALWHTKTQMPPSSTTLPRTL